MNPTIFWEAIGNGILWSTDILFDHIGNILNYTIIAVGLFGIAVWLRFQLRYIKEAKKNPGGIH